MALSTYKCVRGVGVAGQAVNFAYTASTLGGEDVLVVARDALPGPPVAGDLIGLTDGTTKTVIDSPTALVPYVVSGTDYKIYVA